MNILVIGNGFDLAHGLPTKYTDFLRFVEVVRKILNAKGNEINDIDWKDIHLEIKRLIKKNIFLNEEEWKELLEENAWIDYFLQNPIYKTENWIDFESEISKKIQELDKYMQKEDELSSIMCIPFFAKYFREIQEKKEQEKAIELENEMINEWFNNPNKYEFNGFETEYYLESCDELKNYKNMIFRLEKDLNKLIRALEIYLIEYVGKIECDKISPDIEKIVICKEKYKNETVKKSISKVLSFNYSDTYERLYLSKHAKLSDEYIHYIHGKANIDNTIETNNMVLGIDEYLDDKRKNKDVVLIAFKKFYQRIYKETGCKYKLWVEQIRNEYKEYEERKKEAIERSKMYMQEDMHRITYQLKANEIKNEKYKMHYLYIFGHSLDITDGDVLRDLILNDNVYTTIFYYNKDVMGQQIANLVKVIGQDELIKRTGGSTKTIEFKMQQDMVDRGHIYEND